MSWPPIIERFEAKYEPEPTTGCWLWTAGRDRFGYGQFTFPGNQHVLAHRASYMLFIGPIPDGMCVLHHCDTPPCVNPSHLWLGTNDQNMADMAMKGRARSRGRLTQRPGERQRRLARGLAV